MIHNIFRTIRSYSTKYGFDTLCVHAGQEVGETGAINVPVCRSSTFVIEKNEDPNAEEIFDIRPDRIYSRWMNPTRTALENKIAELEGLENLVNLKYLSLNNNEIAEIKGLDSLINLEFLDLSENHT